MPFFSIPAVELLSGLKIKRARHNLIVQGTVESFIECKIIYKLPSPEMHFDQHVMHDLRQSEIRFNDFLLFAWIYPTDDGI